MALTQDRWDSERMSNADSRGALPNIAMIGTTLIALPLKKHFIYGRDGKHGKSGSQITD